ncbi:DNA topoisomerase, partial [Thermoproteota archaeon]
TRADIIKMLYTRCYISSNNIFATDIAFSVVETMENYNPQIISTDMTRKIEKNLEEIERLDLDESIVIQNAVDQIYECLTIIKKDEKVIGTNIGQAFFTTILEQNLLCSCPICKTGTLSIIRSNKTGKRFVGCSGYSKGCHASSPLPKKGKIIVTGKICNTCSWPIINMAFKNKPWKFCVNIKCASKKVKKDEM